MNKHTLLTLGIAHVLGLFCLPVIAQDVAYSNKLISRLQATSAPAFGLRNKPGLNGRCITPLLTEAKRNAHLLTAEAKTALKPLTDRPTLSNEQVGFTDHFTFHYTITGSDAVPPADANSNGAPDYVDNMAAIFEHVYQEYLTRGYTMPPDDGTAGGDQYYDIYIHDIGVGLYGFVSSETTIGNNPKSPVLAEWDASTSWMGMSSDYSWVSGTTQTQAIQVTAAHEFFHAVQMGTTLGTTNFLSEATAAWSEDEIYPGIDDNFQYLTSIFNTPDVALNWSSDDDPDDIYGGHWYGAWIYFRYLSEQTSPDIIRRIYTRYITDYEMDAIHNEVAASGLTGLASTFVNFWIANTLLTSNSTYAPYTYSRASAYLTATEGGILPEANLAFTGANLTYISNSQGNGRLMRLGADYFTLDASQNFKITFQLTGNQDVVPVLVKKNSQTGAVTIANSTTVGNSEVIFVDDASAFNEFHLLVLRGDFAATDTLSAQYTIQITPRPAVSTDPVASSTVQVYPNPASDTIRVVAAGATVVNQLVLTDLNGREIRTAETAWMDLSGISAGIYLAKVSTSEGISIHRVEIVR